jgi:hypothetical protein
MYVRGYNVGEGRVIGHNGLGLENWPNFEVKIEPVR